MRTRSSLLPTPFIQKSPSKETVVSPTQMKVSNAGWLIQSSSLSCTNSQLSLFTLISFMFQE